MKLIRQTILVFREGKSDKVYEVDLCEVGADRYVVNFRYGRRGTSLKEGSKTSSAVSRAEADKVFGELVSSKIRKGYREVTGETLDPQPAMRPAVAAPVDTDARNQAVLNRLAEGPSGKKKKTWPLERAIWRAGELRIRAAAPMLIGYIGSGGALRDYCICWALGWCGDESAIAPLDRLYKSTSTPDPVRRIAIEALLKLSDDETKARLRHEMIEQLPDSLRELARNRPAEEFQSALTAYLDKEDHREFGVLDKLYLIDNEQVRPALLEMIRTAPLRPNYFQRLRHIFKAAEYRRDAQVFGLLGYRFEKTRAMFANHEFALSKDRRYSYVSVEGRFIQDGRKEIQSGPSSIAYGSRTRAYLRRRVWRTLRRMGELGDVDYVKMAVGVLLAYSDDDALPEKESSYYDWRTRETRQVRWDAYASYRAFNHILYSNSPRYELRPNSVAWRCSPAYRPGDEAPASREEAFPKLWEQAPVGLLHLISESRCRPVIEFAARALADCKQFCAGLDADVVMMILSRPYEAAARLGLKLARDHYRAADPDHDLVLAVAGSQLDEAREQARRWIDENRYHFTRDTDFLAALATSEHADMRDYARRLLISTSLEGGVERALIGRIIARLLALDPAQGDYAKDVADTALKCFTVKLRSLGMDTILDLLGHPLMEVQVLGASILLSHDTRPDHIPEGVIESLIASGFESIRVVGIRLFGQLSDQTLLASEGLIMQFARHELADIRNSIRPVIKRLASGDSRFAARLSEAFIQTLLGPEPHEGVHSSLVKMMMEDLGDGWKTAATRGTAWRLIQSKSQAAEELGGCLIEFKLSSEGGFADGFDTTEIAELSNHEVMAVRRAAWRIFAKVVSRFRQSTNPEGHLEEMAKAVRLLDSPWDDSRNHWIDVFRTSFTSEDFTPAILVSICDSVRGDVQQLGREMITRFFEEESGQEYLLKLSEHPSADLQLFATNYLERYAAGDPARLRQLRPYFLSVLSRVNRARVAKGRVIAFLTAEAEKSEESARIAGEIFARQSVTIARGDRAAAIEAMLRIRRAYPDLKLPIKVREPEVRNAV